MPKYNTSSPARRAGSLSATLAAARQRHVKSSEQTDQDCTYDSRRPVPLKRQAICTSKDRQTYQRLLHMDDCNDPNCPDAEQLKDWQQSIDHFTDYEHYERCCDEGGHHHHHCTHDGMVVEDVVCGEPTSQIVSSARSKAGQRADCDECLDDCDECVEKHVDCYEEVDVCQNDCEQCEEECEDRGHEREDCPQDHPTTRDNCIDSCSIPLPLLGPTDDFDLQTLSRTIRQLTPCTANCDMPVQPFQIPHPADHDGAFNTALDHWQTFVQTHHCAPDPCLVDNMSQFAPPQHIDPSFGFSFGCDPTNPANQYQWQLQQQQLPQCTFPATPTMASNISTSPIPLQAYATSTRSLAPSTTPSMSSQVSTATTSSVPTTAVTESTQDRTCQWIMPCGSICGATFERTDHLRTHVKNSHAVKGTVACGWKDCSASFATEAALTGHISKKHLSFDEEGPWKCTFPNCTKSFMYKQVRDEHMASHNGGNRMHCPICHQWLNAEGSNFRRHMASHNPKNEHMKCKYEDLGCKKRFPRVDNLRRHEACCKFGKRALGVHHHHHKVHLHS